MPSNSVRLKAILQTPKSLESLASLETNIYTLEVLNIASQFYLLPPTIAKLRIFAYYSDHFESCPLERMCSLTMITIHA